MEHPGGGILIAVEGIDGTGKTTQVGLLADTLKAAGEDVVRSKEPTDGPWGQRIRSSAATGRMSLTEEIQTFVEDRKEHVRNLIRPALSAGKTVLLDRYFYSTIAYQGARGASVDALTAHMRSIAPEPDVVLLIDLPPEVGLARISHGRGETPNQFENHANLEAVRQVFLQLRDQHPNIVTIDGSRSVEAVHRAIIRVLADGVFKINRCAKPWGCDEPLLCVYSIAGTCRWARIRGIVRPEGPA